MLRTQPHHMGAERLGMGAGQKVHLRRSDEPGDEKRIGLFIKLKRRADLLHAPVAQHADAVCQCHRLHLIVRHIDHGGVFHALVKPGDLKPCRHTQRRIEIGQGLIEKEHLRITHNGAADGDALALPAGKLARQALQIRRKLQHFGGGMNAGLAFLPALPASCMPKAMFS